MVGNKCESLSLKYASKLGFKFHILSVQKFTLGNYSSLGASSFDHSGLWQLLISVASNSYQSNKFFPPKVVSALVRISSLVIISSIVSFGNVAIFFTYVTCANEVQKQVAVEFWF